MQNKKNNLILGFNLFEMIITMAIIAILATVGMTRLSKLKSPKEIVDETTNIITSTINQVIFDSLNSSTSLNICNVQIGKDNNRAACNLDLTIPPSTNIIAEWDNINNIIFNNKVNVRFNYNQGLNVISQITYTKGLISSIVDPKNPKETINITSANESSITPIIITVEFISTTSCSNIVNLWPNNVITITQECTRM